MNHSVALVSLMIVGSLIGDPAPVDVFRLPPGTLQPVGVTDAEGTVHWVWLQGEPGACDVYYQRWPDGNPVNTPTLRVNSQPGSAVAVGTIRGAQIALGREGWVHVVWNGTSTAETAPGDGAPLLYSRLSRSGTAFDPSRNLRGTTAFLDGGASVAPDASGRVTVVWHAATQRDGATEKNRHVFAARSVDDGTHFLPAEILDPEGGVCGCCGLRAFLDPAGHLSVLYRAAGNSSGRPMVLLENSETRGPTRTVLSDPWPIEGCPMSTSTLVAGSHRVLAAWETEAHIRFASVASGSATTPSITTVSGDTPARHPALAVNAKGEILCVWAEGTGWQRGGGVAWRTLSASGAPTGPIQRRDGLPVWSFPAAYARPDGTFVIAY